MMRKLSLVVLLLVLLAGAAYAEPPFINVSQAPNYIDQMVNIKGTAGHYGPGATANTYIFSLTDAFSKTIRVRTDAPPELARTYVVTGTIISPSNSDQLVLVEKERRTAYTGLGFEETPQTGTPPGTAGEATGAGAG
ncbi:MAG: hypothetical protein ABFD96_16295, partial [Armatimonadia bacterium]